MSRDVMTRLKLVVAAVATVHLAATVALLARPGIEVGDEIALHVWAANVLPIKDG
jgi:hypothetical protein